MAASHRMQRFRRITQEAKYAKPTGRLSPPAPSMPGLRERSSATRNCCFYKALSERLEVCVGGPAREAPLELRDRPIPPIPFPRRATPRSQWTPWSSSSTFSGIPARSVAACRQVRLIAGGLFIVDDETGRFGLSSSRTRSPRFTKSSAAARGLTAFWHTRLDALRIDLAGTLGLECRAGEAARLSARLRSRPRMCGPRSRPRTLRGHPPSGGLPEVRPDLAGAVGPSAGPLPGEWNLSERAQRSCALPSSGASSSTRWYTARALSAGPSERGISQLEIYFRQPRSIACPKRVFDALLMVAHRIGVQPMMTLAVTAPLQDPGLARVRSSRPPTLESSLAIAAVQKRFRERPTQ